MTGVWRRMTGVAMGLLMAVNTACYSYVPVTGAASPASGKQVKVRLTAEGTSAIASQLGPGVQWMDGILSDRRPDGTIVVGVTQVRLTSGLDQFWTGQAVVTIPGSHVAELQERTVDKGRSRIALVALAAALIGVAAIAFGAAGSAGAPDLGGGQPPP